MFCHALCTATVSLCASSIVRYGVRFRFQIWRNARFTMKNATRTLHRACNYSFTSLKVWKGLERKNSIRVTSLDGRCVMSDSEISTKVCDCWVKVKKIHYTFKNQILKTQNFEMKALAKDSPRALTLSEKQPQQSSIAQKNAQCLDKPQIVASNHFNFVSAETLHIFTSEERSCWRCHRTILQSRQIQEANLQWYSIFPHDTCPIPTSHRSQSHFKDLVLLVQHSILYWLKGICTICMWGQRQS